MISQDEFDALPGDSDDDNDSGVLVNDGNNDSNSDSGFTDDDSVDSDDQHPVVITTVDAILDRNREYTVETHSQYPQQFIRGIIVIIVCIYVLTPYKARLHCSVPATHSSSLADVDRGWCVTLYPVILSLSLPAKRWKYTEWVDVSLEHTTAVVVPRWMDLPVNETHSKLYIHHAKPPARTLFYDFCDDYAYAQRVYDEVKAFIARIQWERMRNGAHTAHMWIVRLRRIPIVGHAFARLVAAVFGGGGGDAIDDEMMMNNVHEYLSLYIYVSHSQTWLHCIGICVCIACVWIVFASSRERIHVDNHAQVMRVQSYNLLGVCVYDVSIRFAQIHKLHITPNTRLLRVVYDDDCDDDDDDDGDALKGLVINDDDDDDCGFQEIGDDSVTMRRSITLLCGEYVDKAHMQNDLKRAAKIQSLLTILQHHHGDDDH